MIYKSGEFFLKLIPIGNKPTQVYLDMVLKINKENNNTEMDEWRKNQPDVSNTMAVISFFIKIKTILK